MTRHNLSLLLGPLDGGDSSSRTDPPKPGPSLYNLATGTLTVLVAAGVILSALLLAGVLA